MPYVGLPADADISAIPSEGYVGLPADADLSVPKGIAPQRDPFSYSPAETEKMRADFVAAEGGSVFGGNQDGNKRAVMGIASPSGRKSAATAVQKLNEPTAAPTGPVDFVTRVVPESVAKNVKGALEMPYVMGKRIVDPVVDATADYVYGDKSGGRAVWEGGSGAVKGLAQNVGDVGKFFGTKAGVIAPDEEGNLNPTINPVTIGKRVWHEATTDPVGTGIAAVGAKGIAKGTVGVAKNGVSNIGLKGDAELATLSNVHDVPLSVGEQVGNPALKTVETQLERVPMVGTRGFRVTQSTKLSEAANRLVDRFAPENITDIPDQIQTSMFKTLKEGKDAIGNIQRQINRAVTANATDPIPTANLQAAATILLEQFPDIFDRLPSTPLKDRLTTIAKGTETKTDAITNTTAPSALTWKESMLLREQLNDYISRAYKSAGAVGNKEIYQLSELKRGLDSDINAWGENSTNSKVVDLFKKRNEEYIKKVVPFKDAAVKTATGTTFDTDLLFKHFVQPDRPQLARKLMNALDDEGQGLVRYSVLKKALDAGQDAKPGAPFSPGKFAKEIDRLGSTINELFPGEDKRLIQGFVKLSRAAERAGQYAENPPNSVRVGDLGVTGVAGYGLSAHPLLTAGGLTAAKVLSSLLTSNAGKRLLVRAARVPETSSMWEGMLQELKQFTDEAAPGVVAGTAGQRIDTADVANPSPTKNPGESPMAFKRRLTEWGRENANPIQVE